MQVSCLSSDSWVATWLVLPIGYSFVIDYCLLYYIGGRGKFEVSFYSVSHLSGVDVFLVRPLGTSLSSWHWPIILFCCSHIESQARKKKFAAFTTSQWWFWERKLLLEVECWRSGPSLNLTVVMVFFYKISSANGLVKFACANHIIWRNKKELVF